MSAEGNKMSFSGKPHGCRFILSGPKDQFSGRPGVFAIADATGVVVATGLSETDAVGLVKDKKFGGRTYAFEVSTGRTVAGPGREGKPNGKTAKKKGKTAPSAA